MIFLKQPFRFGIVFTLAIPLLCVLLASVVTRGGASNGLVKKKPSVVLQASKASIRLPCSTGWISMSGSCSSTSTAELRVELTSMAKDFSKPTYSYTVAAGQIIGEGSNVTWDLNGVGPGFYTATVEVHDHKKNRAQSSVAVSIHHCPDCVSNEWCPLIVVTCYDQVTAGTAITCKAVVSPWLDSFTLEWSVHDSTGESVSDRVSKRGPYISIRTDGLGGRAVTATVEVKGVASYCPRTASYSTGVKP